MMGDRLAGVPRIGRAAALVLALALGLGGCDSAEERAERHFNAALALIEAGDADRALVELRNVFQLDGNHREARRIYAETQLARGEIADAWGNYLRLAEQYPDDIGARRVLADLAARAGDWENARRHAQAGAALAPDDPGLASVLAALAYRAAVESRDDAARAAAVVRARALVDAGGPVFAARNVVIDDLVARAQDGDALAEIDSALQEHPDEAELHHLRLRLLMRVGAGAEVSAQLRAMVERFPQDATLPDRLLAWYRDRGLEAEAAAFLRERAAADPADPWPRLALVRHLNDTAGPDAALAELQRLAETAPNAGLALRYRVVAALRRHDDGAADAVIDELAALIAGLSAAERDLPEARDAAVTLARLLRGAGRDHEAEPLIAGVLAADAGHVGALRIQAARAIAADRTDEAIVLLRRALAEDPRDAATMTLMAEAHLRDGSRDLAGERLALAVEVSGRGVAESLRYAGFLIDVGREAAAETVLMDALRANPGRAELIAGLAELRIRRGAHDLARRDLAALRAGDDGAAGPVLRRLEAQLLEAEGRRDDLVAFLDTLVGQGAGDISAVAMIAQTLLADGKPQEAAGYVERLMQASPGDPSLRFLRAGLHAMEGELAAAEDIYAALMAEHPGAEGPVRALHALLSGQGRDAEAAAVLRAGIAERPDSAMLNWMLASDLETAGDIDGAIAIYETLHAAAPENDVFANNLASLLSRHRADAETLLRAQRIARRLRAADEPAFRSTWGWILFLRGDAAASLPHLRHAAEGLPDHAEIQYQLGRALAGTGQVAAARPVLERAAALDAGGAIALRAEAALAGLAAAEAARTGQ